MASTLLSNIQSSFEKIIDSISPGINVEFARNSDDAIYAAYVFSLVLRAVERVAKPNSIQLRSFQRTQPSPSPLRTFTIRGAPGYIYSAHREYGYCEFSYAGHRYEIHFGVRFFGSSHVLHEFDISIIDANDAERCRNRHESPSSGNPKAIFECKFYSSTLGINLGREFVGLLADFRGIPIQRLVTNTDSGSIRNYLSKKNRPKFNGLVSASNPQMETEFINAVAEDIRTRLI